MQMTKEQARDYIKRNPGLILARLQPAKVKGQYVCPFCGHGANGDGLDIAATGEHCGKFHCFGCNAKGDVIDLLGQIEGITTDKERFARAYELYGIETGNLPALDAPAPIPPKEKTPEELATERREEWVRARADELARADIATASSNANAPECLEYLQRRGIPADIAKRHNVGFIPDWKHPLVMARLEYQGADKPEEWKRYGGVPATPRLIVPTGDCNYLARDTRQVIPPEQDKYKKAKAGDIRLFGLEGINTPRPIFIVEGEIDAMSIEAAGGNAVALGSTTQAGKLIEALGKWQKDLPKTMSLVIALDNDEAGLKATGEIAAGLDRLNQRQAQFSYRAANPAGNCKDANEALTKDPAGLKARVAEIALSFAGEITDLDGALMDYSRREKPIATGFSELDKELGGGLRPGVIYIGGVSSGGKTAFCMQMIDQIARSGRYCMAFTLEMAKRDIMARSLARETAALSTGQFDVTAWSQLEIQDGYLHAKIQRENPDKWNVREKAIANYRQYCKRIFFYENYNPARTNGDELGGYGKVDISYIFRRIDNFCKVTGERPVVLIDYLQIITPGDNDRGADKRQMIDDIVSKLKAITVKNPIPIVVISSLSRDNYTKPLAISAFKESGNIEYSGDVLLGLQFRDVHKYPFMPDDEHKGKEGTIAQQMERLAELKKGNGRAGSPREMEIVILKNRGYKCTGEIPLDFYPAHFLFTPGQNVDISAIISKGVK